MRLKSIKILGVEITIENKEYILEEIRKYLKTAEISGSISPNKSLTLLEIFTPNPEIINFAQIDPFFKQIVNSAQINLPDGNGVVWAIKKLHKLEIKRISGVDFFADLVSLAHQERFRIGLIGGRHNLAVKVKECLFKKHKNLKIEVLEEPEVKIRKNSLHIANFQNSQKYFQELCKTIARKKIDILFVALGFPKQEYFINRLATYSGQFKISKSVVMMAVGGSFDYLAGKIRRAPLWMRTCGLEWFYRLIGEPWRIKRHLVGSQFFLRVLVHSRSVLHNLLFGLKFN